MSAVPTKAQLKRALEVLDQSGITQIGGIRLDALRRTAASSADYHEVKMARALITLRAELVAADHRVAELTQQVGRDG